MEPPDPFSNSEVKHRCANGSVVRPCESRSSSAPYTLKSPQQVILLGAFFCGYVNILDIGKIMSGEQQDDFSNRFVKVVNIMIKKNLGNADLNQIARLPFPQACENNKNLILEVLNQELRDYYHVF